jgi:two-component system CheB/CheR fusion protein
MRQAARQDGEVVRERVRVKTEGEETYVDLLVGRIRQPGGEGNLLMVSFRPTSPPREEKGGKKTASKPEEDGERIEELGRELQYTKESLQTTVEELETSNEELTSTNEELQSTNEELQSANEELETSKEELQSLNEELTTVNAELSSKVGELSRANDDVLNLLNGIGIATVFLDNDLNIKRYTEQAIKLIKLIQTDLGRPLGDLVSNIIDDTILEDCRQVLKTLIPKEKEVQTNEGGQYLMRTMPYRTAENVIEGLVITFVPTRRME